MSTIEDRIKKLRERYADSISIEPRHVFELIEALSKNIDDIDGVAGTIMAEHGKRLDRLERLAGPSTHR